VRGGTGRTSYRKDASGAWGTGRERMPRKDAREVKRGRADERKGRGGTKEKREKVGDERGVGTGIQEEGETSTGEEKMGGKGRGG